MAETKSLSRDGKCVPKQIKTSEVSELFYHKQKTVTEIAMMLGVTKQAIHYHLRKAEGYAPQS